jgi:hypothetical protein
MAMLVVPYWFPTGLFATMPAAITILAIRRRARPDTNACSSCGYSLTGNTSGVCPECGTPVA